MDRRNFLQSIVGVMAAKPFLLFGSLNASTAITDSHAALINPYEQIDWDSFRQYKAALHVHTIQSDGRHWLDYVVNSYRKAGYSIMAITDHDRTEPNYHTRPTGGREKARLPIEAASPYPKDPKPDNYPANTTWQWTDYGCSSPENLGMIGIEGNELSNGHHINSFFNDTGFTKDDFDEKKDSWEDYELKSVMNRNGYAVINHPMTKIQDHRKPLKWYVDLFKRHSSDYLLGIEITNTYDLEVMEEDLNLWDNMLAMLMPQRTVWGFGTDDMHGLNYPIQAYSSLCLSELSSESVKKAMKQGHFFACRSSRRIDYRHDATSTVAGRVLANRDGMDIFPVVERIDIDRAKGCITISATNCDEIRWISSPKSIPDLDNVNKTLEPGNVVAVGNSLNYLKTPNIKGYVRAELRRNDGEHMQRTFTNPFGLKSN